MLDACPHHHDDHASDTEISRSTLQGQADASAIESGTENSLEGLKLRAPRNSQLTGKKFWRSLDELASTPQFEEMMQREFPHAASEWQDDSSRRTFLKLMGASLALAGVSACTRQASPEKIAPYVVPPEELIPGRPLFYATTMPEFGYAKGVIVESHEGRPTKIEGNVDHPASLGGTDVWMHASMLEMYDPDRAQTVLYGGDHSSWGAFTAAISDEMTKLRAKNGSGLRFLTGAVTSPTIARQINQIIKEMPQAKWHQWEPIGRDNQRAGAIVAFGRDVQSVYQFENADIVVSLDCNFLQDGPGNVVYARKFIDRRRIRNEASSSMNRLYVAEANPTITGAMADHRLPTNASDIEALARDLANAIIRPGSGGNDARDKWISALARDLTVSRGRSIILAGESQPAAVHALVHALNEFLGNVDQTVRYVSPIEATGPDGPHTLAELVNDANAGQVDVLFVLGSNPAFTAPVDMGLTAGVNNADPKEMARNPLGKIRLRVFHGLYNLHHDETAFLCHWNLPASHFLESWGDARAFEGTASLIQPLMYPLYGSKSEIELLSILTGQSDQPAYETVRQTWRDQLPAPFERNWQIALEKGVIPDTAAKSVTVSLTADLAAAAGKPIASSPSADKYASTYQVNFRPDPSVWDGRYANNGWLQELPRPITKITWDNVALMSVKTARGLGIEPAQEGKSSSVSLIDLSVNGRTLRIPAYPVPGHAEGSITVNLGYGRTLSGRTGTGVGANANSIRTAANPWFAGDATVALTGERVDLATTQGHQLIEINGKTTGEIAEERELIQVRLLSELQSESTKLGGNGKVIHLPIHHVPTAEERKKGTLYPLWEYNYNKWGMVIDTNACIGCNACVIACQSENNIPVVGKEAVMRHREMHWLRIDTYFQGDPLSNPDTFFEPLPCMQCENAPCEEVCPVQATSHSAEGLNEQTYNRCVGTRYCSNNCPYKVRRFNFFQYQYPSPSQELMQNPNVTVRSRGVMEKCNYCVQRINNARIESKKRGEPYVADGSFTTACAQACPTQAIIFGNLNDPHGEVKKLQEEPLRFTLLDELNTQPRTSYLARVKNPNPELGSNKHEG